MRKILSLFVASLFCATMFADTDTKTIYCKVTQGWWTESGAAVAVHYWGDGSTDYPGVRMTPVSCEDGLWTYDIPANVTGILFARVNGSGDVSHWGAQTEDITSIANNDLFTITSPSQASTVAYVKSTYEPRPTVKLAGTMTDWATNAECLIPAENRLSASVTVTLNAGTYEFRMLSNGNYLSLNGEGESLFSINRHWKHADHVNLVNNGRNFQLVADLDGDYTFTWTYADSNLVVTFPTIPVVQLNGDMTTWGEHPVTLTPAADSLSASASVFVSASDNHQFKIVSDGNYLTRDGSGGLYRIHRDFNHVDHLDKVNTGDNLKLDADVAGYYTFTWTYADSSLVVSFPEAVSIVGTFNEWNVAANVMTRDEGTASRTIHLDANTTYTMKVWLNGRYYTKYGAEQVGEEHPYFVKRIYAQAEHVNVIVDDNNMRLVADIAGDYTFTWRYADSTLLVTYPELPTVSIVGGFNSWVVNANVMTPSANMETASVTLSNLASADYYMKVYVAGTYYTKYGDNGQPYRIWREWYNIPSVDVDVNENNMKLEADVTGNYTFTWTYATKNLVVTFPPTTPTAIDNTDANTKAVKQIVNGQLFIIRDGKTFNALGVEVK